MRDINRIDEICNMFLEEWKKNPDLRFFQQIEIMKHYFGKEDCFYVEDDKVIEFLRRNKND